MQLILAKLDNEIYEAHPCSIHARTMGTILYHAYVSISTSCAFSMKIPKICEMKSTSSKINVIFGVRMRICSTKFRLGAISVSFCNYSHNSMDM